MHTKQLIQCLEGISAQNLHVELLMAFRFLVILDYPSPSLPASRPISGTSGPGNVLPYMYGRMDSMTHSQGSLQLLQGLKTPSLTRWPISFLESSS